MSESLDQPGAPRPADDERWAREMLGKVALAAVVEQRRRRRWGIFFKLLFFAYIVVVAALIFSPEDGMPAATSRHTAVVDLEGMIMSGGDADAENVIAGLRAAFKSGSVAGVILRLNSPGGSPVQAAEIYDEIGRLRAAHPNTPLYAVTTDVCASGCYYVAAAAQKIYANPSSIIGSIGVIAGGFGFEQTIEKLGISRRVYTAGDNKDFLDPFRPPRDSDVRHLQGILNDIHQQFIQAVRKGRGDRLKETPDMFSGLVWTGEKSVEMGLIDELADARRVAKDVIGAEKLVDYTRKPRVFDRLFEGVESSFERALGRVLGRPGEYNLR